MAENAKAKAKYISGHNSFFYHVFENVNASIVIVDAEGGIIYGNSVYRSIVGKENLELLGVNFDEFVLAGEEKQEWRNILSAMSSGIISAKMTCHIRSTNRRIYLEISLNPITLDQEPTSYFVVTGIDRSAEHEADVREERARQLVRKNMKELQEYSSYVNNIIELSPIGIWVIQYLPLESQENDPQYEWHEKVGARAVIAHVNQEVINTFGFEKNELIGKSIFDPSFVDDDAANVYLGEIRNRRNKKPGSYEIHMKQKSGDQKPVMIKAIPTQLEPGTDKVLESVGMILDLSERRASEKKIARMNQRLRELNKELENNNMYLQKIAVTDTLTGVANRRGFEEYAGDEWRKAKKFRNDLSLILFDIDFFKAYNDLYGHQQGDVCLSAVADAVKGDLKRSNDYISRYGGEEFVVVLPATNKEGAANIAERLCQVVRDLKIPHEASEISRFLTISLGVACMSPEDDISLEDAIKHADQALYQAKENGRNQVQVHNAMNKVNEVQNEHP